MADIFNTAVSGLLAYRTAISTTSNNITNVNTDGYSRQRVLLESRPGEIIPQGTIGNGVDVAAVERMFNAFDSELINQYQSSSSRLEILGDLASRIDDVVADPASNLTPAMDDFFSSANDVVNDPTSIAPRQVMLGQGEVLVERFKFLATQMNQLDQEVDQRLGYVVNDINALASDLANLNTSIVRSLSLSDVPPADLLDKRDLLLKELSEKVEATAVEQADGSVNVFIGTGQLLVSSGNTFDLEVNVDEFQPDRLSVYLNSGFSQVDISANLHGGEIGGLLDFRNNLLDSAMNRLGRIAIALSTSFNDQHRAGIDLEGNVGKTFFRADTHSPQITNNTAAGDLLVEVGGSTALNTSGYRLEYNDDGVAPAYYEVFRLSDNTSQTFLAALPDFTVDGLTFTPSGAFADGESITINAGPPLAQVLPRGTNSATANLEVQITDVGQLTDSDYRIDFRYGQYTVTRLSDSTEVYSGTSTPIEVDGLQFIPSALVDGDSFYVRPTRNAALNLSLQVHNPNEIATASPFRVSVDPLNVGEAQIEITDIDSDLLDFIPRSATITGTQVVGNPDLSGAGNEATFDLTIDGVTRTVTVNVNTNADLNGDFVTDANDTVFAVQQAINTAFGLAGDPSASVALDGNNLSITSDTTGAGSGIGITNTNAVTDVQFGLAGLAATGDTFTANFVFKDAVLPATGILVDVLDAAGNPLTDNTGTLLQDIAYTPGMTFNVNAWTTRVTGVPVAEDTLTLNFNSDATQDNRNILSIAQLENSAILNAGTSTYSQSYGALIAEVGTQTAQIEINRDAENVLLDNAILNREETSGVNLDEEAADLIRYQQAYTAITRVIQTARTIFDSIIDVV